MVSPDTNRLIDRDVEKSGRDENEFVPNGDKPETGAGSSLKYISLVVLTLQNAVLILVMRYVRVRKGDMFIASTAVVMTELLKFIASLTFIFLEQGCNVRLWLQYLHEHTIKQPLDCLKVSVPAIVYMLQNNLLYVALSNLEAATFQVTYQLKILTTAIFSVIMLRKALSRLQWVALVILFIGVSAVQLQPHDSKVSKKVATEQNHLVGLVAVIVSCVMSGFAGVYFEKILKGTKPSLWLRNAQLASIGVVFGLITVIINDGDELRGKSYFFGYDWVVWFVICLQSFGGLLVAVVVKYADNILKGFATSAAIILSCVLSIYLFDFKLSVQFTIGASLVMVSLYMYSRYVPKPAALLPTQA
ncbi:hypothetical protein NP493_694g01020 [Ridgeia piscesae]|uniref:UDP-N-acetylglucosamine transporter n=1 Tax=Ridgeia piscesae TaxID=27915 RepID=A0AAD9NPG3_RIDPI|nr:hypothetical protein NP493_694g01020 [Ridgeia piscesae]